MAGASTAFLASRCSSPPKMVLKTVSAITSAAANEIHVGKLIQAAVSTNAVTIGHDNFRMIDCQVEHHTAKGVVRDSSATNTVLVNVYVNNVGAPSGQQAEASSGYNNIEAVGSDGTYYVNVRLRGGSSGIYHLTSDIAAISNLEGYDFKGPFPRGQLFQFNQCDNVHVSDFSCINDPDNSWPEDVCSFYRCNDSTATRGFLDGNNSQAGVGYMCEGSVDCTISFVDVVNMANGSFSAFSVESVQAGTNIHYDDCRTKDNIVTSQGRGTPLSNGLWFAAYNDDLTGIEFNRCLWYNDANPSTGVFYLSTYIDVEDFTEEDFTPRAAIELTFAWE